MKKIFFLFLLCLTVNGYSDATNFEVGDVFESKKSTTSLKNLTKLCEKITGNKIPFGKITKTSIYDIPYFVTENKKIAKFYKWKPKKNISNVVTDTYDWLSKNKNQIEKYF